MDGAGEILALRATTGVRTGDNCRLKGKIDSRSAFGPGSGSEEKQVTGQHHDGITPAIPPVQADGLRHWQVAGGVIIDARGLLLVENLRRNGEVDWSTPGGVVDPGETAVEGLTREVKEETGLTVSAWTGPIYRVEVTAPDAGFFLAVEAHRAEHFDGSISIDDPDGIVIAAEFVELPDTRSRLADASPWVIEPLLAHLDDGVNDGRVFRYHMVGGRGDQRTITRLDDAEQ